MTEPEPGAKIEVAASGHGEVLTQWSASCPESFWSVSLIFTRVADGRRAQSDGLNFAAPRVQASGRRLYPLEMRKGLKTETFRLVVTLDCKGKRVIGDTIFTLVRASKPPPPPKEKCVPGTGPPTLKPSKSILERIKQEEGGLHRTLYCDRYKLDCSGEKTGNCTIGWGHLVHHGPCTFDGADTDPEGRTFKDAITEQEAQRIFDDDVSQKVDLLKRVLDTPPLNQNQYDALLDMAFNTGAFGNGYFKRLLNCGDFPGAAFKMLAFDKSNGEQVPALVERRQFDRALFNRPVS